MSHDDRVEIGADVDRAPEARPIEVVESGFGKVMREHDVLDACSARRVETLLRRGMELDQARDQGLPRWWGVNGWGGSTRIDDQHVGTV